MANKDLRDWVAGLEAAGQLQMVTGADREEEIGAIVDIHMRDMTNPAVGATARTTASLHARPPRPRPRPARMRLSGTVTSPGHMNYLFTIDCRACLIAPVT